MSVDCRQVAFEAVKDRLPSGFSFEQFLSKVTRFSFIPVKLKGKVVGAIMADGPEVHAAILPEAHNRWFNRTTIRWLNHRLSKFGKLVTKVLDDHTMGHEFAVRLGFRAVSHSGNVTFYEKGVS